MVLKLIIEGFITKLIIQPTNHHKRAADPVIIIVTENQPINQSMAHLDECKPADKNTNEGFVIHTVGDNNEGWCLGSEKPTRDT